MNKRMTLVLTALLLLALAGTALAEAFDFSGRWQDPNDDKAMLSIMRIQESDATAEQPRYDVRLIRTESADAGSVWAMSATCDPGTDTLVYTEGAKRSVTFGEDGGIASEETLWDDSEGAFTPVEGALQWTDSRDGELSGGLRFVRVAPAAPSADAFLSDYLTPVVEVRIGAAGSSLSQAILVRDIARFAFDNALWDADVTAMRANMLEARERLDPEARQAFDGNFSDFIAGQVREALDDYGADAGRYEDAGVGDDMARLMGDAEARASLEALLAATLAMENEGGGEA